MQVDREFSLECTIPHLGTTDYKPHTGCDTLIQVDQVLHIRFSEFGFSIPAVYCLCKCTELRLVLGRYTKNQGYIPLQNCKYLEVLLQKSSILLICLIN